MKSSERTILLMIMAAAVAGSAVASSEIRPLAGSRNDRVVAAAAGFGGVCVTARDMRVDLEFPDGTTAKGRVKIVFDRSTGLFLHMLEWFPKEDYPRRPWLDAWQIGIDVDRLFMVCLGMTELDIVQSTEKADSLDDAESKSLKWHTDHTTQTATLPGWGGTIRLMLVRDLFPKGFFASDYDQRPNLPVRLVDMVKQDGEWDLTLESTDRNPTLEPSEKQKRAKVMIFRKGDAWGMGSIRPE